MRFHTFGNIDNRKMILVHGVLTPWQIWNDAIEHFSKNYFVIVPALDSYLRFADTMSDNTIINMLNSVFRVAILKSDNIDNSRIMFLHGTKGNEVVSAKAAKLMKEIYPQTVVKCFKGYTHAELAIYHSDEWIKTVDEFIS